ncbi:hypothetical protein QX776_14205 [Alteromonadaceae bacterium BrNp21-10]|nr:hypothetical protein [Alteromonadaceae bacterium BrNp21-10]
MLTLSLLLNARLIANVENKGRLTLAFAEGQLNVPNVYRLQCDSAQRVELRDIIGCRVTDAYFHQQQLTLVFDGRIEFSLRLREQHAVTFTDIHGVLHNFKKPL